MPDGGNGDYYDPPEPAWVAELARQAQRIGAVEAWQQQLAEQSAKQAAQQQAASSPSVPAMTETVVQADDDLPVPPIPPEMPVPLNWLPQGEAERLMVGMGWGGERDTAIGWRAMLSGYWPYAAGLGLIVVALFAWRKRR